MTIEDRLLDVDAVVGGERAAANERALHAALRRRADALTVPRFSRSALFQSFFIGGFECSTHCTRQGCRLDLLAATAHDRHAEADYRSLTGRAALEFHRNHTRLVRLVELRPHASRCSEGRNAGDLGPRSLGLAK